MDDVARAEDLRAHAVRTAGCTACALAETRAAVVVGAGAADAELMLVAEAPGFREELAGTPLAGAAAALVERLLGVHGIGLADVFVTSVVKCRPPGGRDPRAEEVAACEPHLFRQIELVRPLLVATLGTFATQLLTGRPDGITRVHGRPQEVTLGAHRLTVLPLYAPAAALYTSTMQRVLEEDVARIPALLDELRAGLPAAGGPAGVVEPAAAPDRDSDRESDRDLELDPEQALAPPPARAAEVVQLGLF
ncbi:MAG: uracil-DNA glycosylase [Gaiella sp.]